MMYNQQYTKKKLNAEHENSGSPSTSLESFNIGVQEAAEILGVNRTRLSQLTSKGVFAFERRRIGSHNRLFYRLNDLLTHQRNGAYGNLESSYKYKERFIESSAPKYQEVVKTFSSIAEEKKELKKPSFVNSRLKIKEQVSTARSLQSAQQLQNQISKILEIQSYLSDIIIQQSNLIQSLKVDIAKQVVSIKSLTNKISLLENKEVIFHQEQQKNYIKESQSNKEISINFKLRSKFPKTSSLYKSTY